MVEMIPSVTGPQVTGDDERQIFELLQSENGEIVSVVTQRLIYILARQELDILAMLIQSCVRWQYVWKFEGEMK